MSRRYLSRIRDAGQLAQAFDNYVTWLRTPRQRNVGQGTPREPSIEVGLEPFSFDIAASSMVRVSASTRSRQRLLTLVNTGATRSNSPIPGGTAIHQTTKFKPAQVVFFEGPAQGVVATSARTGLQYLKYNGDTYTFPFGRSAETEDEQDAFNTIRTAVLATVTTGSRRCSLSPERQYRR